MDRRNLLASGLAAGLGLSGIAFARTSPAARAAGLPGPPGGPGPAEVTREPGLPGWPLFEWEQPGGLVEPGEAVFRPPSLAVYADDTAYADAGTRLKLPPIWVSTLCGHALDVLGNPADTARGPTGPPPGDRPRDQVRVRTRTGDYLTARLPDWADGDPRHTYPPRIRELYQHAMGIRRHVLAAGRPWRPTGVLLAAVALDHRPGHCRDWPRALPVPDSRPYQEFRLPDGPHGLPRAGNPAWPCYRVGRSRVVAATWRPLLPHEIT